MEALDRMPDSAVTDALAELAPDFRYAVYLADVEGFVQGDRRDHGDADRHRHVAAQPRPYQLRGLLADYAKRNGFGRSRGDE